MIKILFLLLSFGCLLDDDEKNQDNEQPTIAQLIKQLGSPKFQLRQQASRQLWLRGREAEDQLRAVAENSGDREVRERASQLTQMFDLGVYHDTPREYAQSVIDFNRGNHDQRGAIIAGLNRSEQWKLALQLISTVDDHTAQFDLIRDRMSAPDRIVNKLVRSGDTKMIDVIFSDPLMIRFYPDQCAWICVTRGNHEQTISDYKSLIASNKHENWQISFLAQVYSASGQIDEALKLTEPFVADSIDAESIVLANYYFYLCGQNDLWGRASDRIDQYVEATKNNPAVEGMWNPEIRRLLIHQQAGQNERLETALAQFKNVRTKSLKSVEAMRILLTLMETDAAIELAGDEQLYEKFEVLCSADRFVDAFKSIDLALDTPQRDQWFKERINLIREVNIDPETDPDQLTRSMQVRRLLPLVTFQLGLVGYEDEALEYMNQLCGAVRTHEKDTLDLRQRVLRFAKLMDRPGKFWDLLSEHFDDGEYEYLIDTLWDDNSAEALQWLAMLESEIENPLERFRTAATIMNADWKDPKHVVNLDEYVAKFENRFGQLDQIVQATRAHAFAVAYRLNNKPNAAKEWLIRAADQGSEQAGMSLAKLYWENGDFKNAQARFEQILNDNSNACVARYLALIAESKINPEKDDLQERIKQAEMCLVGRNDLQLTIDHLADLSEMKLVERLGMRWLNCSKPVSTQNVWIQYRLASLMSENNLAKSYVPWNMFLYSQMDRSSYMVNYTNVGSFVRQANIERIKDSIRNNNIEFTKELAERLHKFQPDIADLGDEITTLLDEHNQSELADQMLDKVVGHYQKQLGHFPDCAMYHNNLAWVCAKSKRRLELAMEHAKKAIAITPNHPTYMDTMAEVAFQMGKIDDAITIIKKCIELDPTYQHFRDQLTKFQSQNK